MSLTWSLKQRVVIILFSFLVTQGIIINVMMPIIGGLNRIKIPASIKVFLFMEFVFYLTLIISRMHQNTSFELIFVHFVILVVVFMDQLIWIHVLILLHLSSVFICLIGRSYSLHVIIQVLFHQPSLFLHQLPNLLCVKENIQRVSLVCSNTPLRNMLSVY